MELFGVGVTIFAAVLSILTGVLTFQSWRNGRWMKQSHQDTLTILDRIEKGQEEFRKSHEETIRYLANLIKETQNLIITEGDKTRQAIKAT